MEKKGIRKIKIVLKDKEGVIKRTLVYPEPNAKKLLNFNSGWQLPDDSKFKYENGEFVDKQKVQAPGKSQTK